MSATQESSAEASPSYSIKINASVALKLASIGENSTANITAGPIYGFDGVESNIISITHAISFPVYNNTDDFFNLKTSNSRFQYDYLNKLKASNYTANLLGWFVCSTGGKFISQSVVEALYQLKENFRNDKSEIPSLLIVYDPSKSTDGYLSLKCFKLSDAFLKTIKSENKFIAKNLIENRLSYKNILEELTVVIKSNHLTNLKIQEFQLDDSNNQLDNLSISPSTYESIKQSTNQLNEAINHFNHNLGNLNYFQRNLNRDIAKINKWEAKVKQDNEEKLKNDPKAKIEDVDWRKEFKLLPPSSKYEYLIATSAVNNICGNLQTTENIEYVKSIGVQNSI
jgi:translation initiation factor 3 subunit H